MLTSLQTERLRLAVEALTRAGAPNLPSRLRDTFTGGDYGAISDVLTQARAWASVVQDGEAPALKLVALDAVGALWAVVELDGFALVDTVELSNFPQQTIFEDGKARRYRG